jgi:riboflavin biosynthesis pyrimidine reductase
MRALLTAADGPATGTDGTVDLHEHYSSAGWLSDGGVRANFISSVDGGASAEGTSRGLQTPGDNQVFGALRDLADVILVGAGTVTAEHYHPSDPSPERRALRERLGLPPVPAIAVVSASLSIDLDAELYRGADPSGPTIVVTGSASPIGRRNDIIDLAASGAGVQLIEAASAADGSVDFASAVAGLRDRGFRRILCEGGPRLMTSAVLSRTLDELCLSVAPMLVGPDGPRIVAGDRWPEEFLPQLSLIGLLVEDDALFCRYRVRI